MNKLLLVIATLFASVSLSFAADISVSDSKELLQLVETKKDFQDAVNLLSSADNASELKDNKELQASVSKLNEKFDGDLSAWTGDQDDNGVKSNPPKSPNEVPSSLWGTFWLSFGAGFLILFTPCVFPMIPMTVSFFTHQSPTKAKGISNALLYMLSIILIYTGVGLILVWIFGETILHVLSTNVWFNLGFFVILVVLAVSFMGAFEIRMPSSWINKADRQADKGGLIGIFFMALVLALVSFSCTGPALGFIIAEAGSAGGLTPVIGMFGFSLALALPFGLFAAFPGWLNSMPQSGGWLNVVKVVLGFVELAFAFKFLSNADLAVQAHLLEREIFVAIWIGIFIVLGIYLLGMIRLPHDSPIEKLSVGRTLLATVALAFALYMIPGLWGGPVKLINAFAPPRNYSEYSGETNTGTVTANNAKPHEAMEVGPQNLYVFTEYEVAAEFAKEQGKPLFVDFTGFNCVNCRKMEESVWGEPGIIEILRDEVVIVSLHTDDGRELPAEEQGDVKLDNGKVLSMTTVGDKWRIKEIKEHGILSQPYYIMEDNAGGFLSNGPADFGSHRDPADFKKWLEDGLKEFEEKK